MLLVQLVAATGCGHSQELARHIWLGLQCMQPMLHVQVAGPGGCGPKAFSWPRGNRSVPFDDSQGPAQLTRGDILAAADASLRRLQTDHIDLYQLHWPSRYIPIFGKKQYNPENVRECVGFEEQVRRMHTCIL